MAAKVRGFRTTQCPGSMAQKQMGLTVYVQINRKGVALRQAMATSRQHPAPLIVNPQISNLPGGILASDWRVLHFWNVNIEAQTFTMRICTVVDDRFSTALFHESLLKFRHPLHTIAH